MSPDVRWYQPPLLLSWLLTGSGRTGEGHRH